MTDASSRTFTLLAGPNGAGKSTLLPHLPVDRGTVMVLVDDLAEPHLLAGKTPAAANLLAGREAVAMLRSLAAGSQSFLHETNLASRFHLTLLETARTHGFHTRLYFIALDSAQLAVDRVARRVAAGGHDVLPRRRIEARWRRGLHYFMNVYRPMVDEWTMIDTSHGLQQVASGSNHPKVVAVESQELWAAYGRLSNIASAAAKPGRSASDQP